MCNPANGFGEEAYKGEMTYWLDLFTPKSWQEFQKLEEQFRVSLSGRWKSVQRVAVGDILVCYMASQSARLP